MNGSGFKNFVPIYGSGWELRECQIKLSTAYATGEGMRVEIAANTTTGYLASASTNSGVTSVGANFIGIMAEPVRATDADYATAFKTKRVWVATSPKALAYFTVGAGTFTQIDVYKTCAIHSDGKSLAVDTNGLGAMIEGYISSTRGICSFSLAPSLTA